MAFKTLTHFHYVEILSPTKWDRITSIQYHHERIKNSSFLHYILTKSENNNIHFDLSNIDYGLFHINPFSLHHWMIFSNIFLLVYKVLFIWDFLVFLLLFPTIVSFLLLVQNQPKVWQRLIFGIIMVGRFYQLFRLFLKNATRLFLKNATRSISLKILVILRGSDRNQFIPFTGMFNQELHFFTSLIYPFEAL